MSDDSLVSKLEDALEGDPRMAKVRVDAENTQEFWNSSLPYIIGYASAAGYGVYDFRFWSDHQTVKLGRIVTEEEMQL